MRHCFPNDAHRFQAIAMDSALGSITFVRIGQTTVWTMARLSHTATLLSTELLDANDLAAEAIVKGENLEAFRLIEGVTRRIAALAPSLLRHKVKADPDEACHKIQIRSYYRNDASLITTDGVGNFCPSPFVLKSLGGQLLPDQFKVSVAVAIFNMALACHLQYKITECSQKTRILSSRARILYRKAAKLLEGNLDGEHMEIFLAICINAMGEAQDQGDLEQIRYWTHRFDKAVNTVKKLPSLFPYILQREVFYNGQFLAAQAA